MSAVAPSAATRLRQRGAPLIVQQREAMRDETRAGRLANIARSNMKRKVRQMRNMFRIHQVRRSKARYSAHFDEPDDDAAGAI
jgi:hypothetical protein